MRCRVLVATLPRPGGALGAEAHLVTVSAESAVSWRTARQRRQAGHGAAERGRPAGTLTLAQEAGRLPARGAGANRAGANRMARACSGSWVQNLLARVP